MVLELIAFLCILPLLFYSLLAIIDTYILDGDEWNVTRMLITSFFLSFTSCILLFIHLMKPTAIDVYKGKTTLEITYRDGVPVDSTVVWKAINDNWRIKHDNK